MSGNQVATINAPAAQQVATSPSRPLAERLFHRSGHKGSEVAVDTKAFNDHVTAQELADYAETTNPARFPSSAIPQAQAFMARFGTDALRKVVAERGMGSNIHVFDVAARAMMHIERLEQQVAALQRQISQRK